METLVKALGPAFAAGFAVQQLLEVLDPLIIKIIGKADKKLVLGIVAFVFGLGLAFGTGLRILQPLGVANAGIWDAIVTGLVISAGTEGINSILKFLGYTKEREKAIAAMEKEAAEDALALVERR
ncbi:MAG: hypothetical protein ACE5JU_18485 [Candidatus Binatia bacterium]